MFAVCLALWTTPIVALIAYLELSRGYARGCRERLRSRAEHLIIAKRWIERHARTQDEFARRWQEELRCLHRAYVSRPARLFCGTGAFRRCLEAELATILMDETASWTFIDRAAYSPRSYEKLVLRILETLGWREEYRDGEHVVVIRGRRRVLLRLEWTIRDLECLSVHVAATAAERAGCAACVITNGRFGGAAIAMAGELDVAALHCSQIDMLTPQFVGSLQSRSTPREELRLAA